MKSNRRGRYIILFFFFFLFFIFSFLLSTAVKGEEKEKDVEKNMPEENEKKKQEEKNNEEQKQKQQEKEKLEEKEEKEKKEEKEEDLPWLKVTKTDRNCEVCQVTTEILINETEKKKHMWEKTKGMLDIFIQTELLNSNFLCSFGMWKDYADKTPDLHVYDMTATCKVLLGEHEETFEENLPKYFIKKNKKNEKIANISEEICVKKLKLCQNVWKEDEKPHNRKHKKDINLQNALLFLNYNKKQDGVHVLANGLQYKILKKNEKKTKKNEQNKIKSANDIVEVKYKGMHLNREIFDQSNSSTFTLSQVIKGWRQGMEMMSVGDIYELYIPPPLAYGSNSAGNKIGPNSALIFEVELLKVQHTGTQEHTQEKKKHEEKEEEEEEEEKEKEGKEEEKKEEKEEENEDIVINEEL